MLSVDHRTILINNIQDKEEILNTLYNIYTDEDFNGNNGEEYISEKALEGGFTSNQEYTLSELRKSNLTGEDLITTFFNEWLGKDYYYSNINIDSFEQDGKTIVTVTYTFGD